MNGDLANAAAAVTIMALGSAFQAAVGMGLALIVVPILALIDPTYIRGPMLLAGTVLAAMTAWRERHALDCSGLLLSLAGLLIGTGAGALAMKALHGPALPKVFGVLVLLAVVLSIVGRPLKVTGMSLSFAGGAAGIIGDNGGHPWPTDWPSCCRMRSLPEPARCWARSSRSHTWARLRRSEQLGCSDGRRWRAPRSCFQVSEWVFLLRLILPLSSIRTG